MADYATYHASGSASATLCRERGPLSHTALSDNNTSWKNGAAPAVHSGLAKRVVQLAATRPIRRVAISARR